MTFEKAEEILDCSDEILQAAKSIETIDEWQSIVMKFTVAHAKAVWDAYDIRRHNNAS